MPPYFPWTKRLKYRLRRAVRREFHLGDMSWGTAGPQALTYYATVHGLAGEAEPIGVFYTVPLEQADHLHWPAGMSGSSSPTGPFASISGIQAVASASCAGGSSSRESP